LLPTPRRTRESETGKSQLASCQALGWDPHPHIASPAWPSIRREAQTGKMKRKVTKLNYYLKILISLFAPTTPQNKNQKTKNLICNEHTLKKGG
jgi:hypothetical protein